MVTFLFAMTKHLTKQERRVCFGSLFKNGHNSSRWRRQLQKNEAAGHTAYPARKQERWVLILRLCVCLAVPYTSHAPVRLVVSIKLHREEPLQVAYQTEWDKHRSKIYKVIRKAEGLSQHRL